MFLKIKIEHHPDRRHPLSGSQGRGCSWMIGPWGRRCMCRGASCPPILRDSLRCLTVRSDSDARGCRRTTFCVAFVCYVPHCCIWAARIKVVRSYFKLAQSASTQQ